MCCELLQTTPGDASTGLTNTTRMCAVIIPLTFFTEGGSTYTGLPVEVFPISFHRVCAPADIAGRRTIKAAKADRMLHNVSSRCVLTIVLGMVAVRSAGLS